MAVTVILIVTVILVVTVITVVLAMSRIGVARRRLVTIAFVFVV